MTPHPDPAGNPGLRLPVTYPGASASGDFQGGTPHPRKQRAIRSGGPGSPSATTAIGVSEAPAFAAQGDVVPFVTDCLSMPERRVVPGVRAATGGDADAP